MTFFAATFFAGRLAAAFFAGAFLAAAFFAGAFLAAAFFAGAFLAAAFFTGAFFLAAFFAGDFFAAFFAVAATGTAFLPGMPANVLNLGRLGGGLSPPVVPGALHRWNSDDVMQRRIEADVKRSRMQKQ